MGAHSNRLVCLCVICYVCVCIFVTRARFTLFSFVFVTWLGFGLLFGPSVRRARKRDRCFFFLLIMAGVVCGLVVIQVALPCLGSSGLVCLGRKGAQIRRPSLGPRSGTL